MTFKLKNEKYENYLKLYYCFVLILEGRNNVISKKDMEAKKM